MKELELLEAICRGIDPRDGSVLNTQRDPNLDEARLTYLHELRRFAQRSVKQVRATSDDRQKMPNHGKSWSTENDSALKSAWNADPTVTCSELASRFGRGEGAIVARLAHLGVFPDRLSAREANTLRVIGGNAEK